MSKQQSATVLLAHGSSDQNWLAPFSDLLGNIRDGLNGERVEMSYMELADPSMEHQITVLAREGFTHIDVMPLFFAAGRHLRKDVPGQIDALQSTLKDEGLQVSITLHPPVGLEPEVTDALRHIVVRQVSANS
ncbi:sirohydrochlorin chelatase [Thalassolituus maritimus]|uniref:Cobalamin biosynthesis protein CbiX n=1 Tax=Thalassolituus maritimus TaxID=484498 RepID=A0ABQ0A0X4_9GAMM|nr:CbiX/SirB N-terminal domain-containing protein [Pseudomonadota bacterium]